MNAIIKFYACLILLLHAAVGAAAIVISDYPQIRLSIPSSAVYTASSGLLSFNSTPSVYLWSSSSGGTVGAPKSLALNLVLNPATGALVSGVAGDDFVLTGILGTSGYSGTLLTGEVLSFAFIDDASDTDSAELRLQVTGGSLATHSGFVGKDIGVLLTLENIRNSAGGVVTTVSFGQDFSASRVKGTLGPILKGTPDEGCTVSMGNYVWNDGNRDGIQQSGELGIDHVTVWLKDSSNNVVQTTATAPGGSGSLSGYYQFTANCGNYKIEVDASTLPAGLVPSDPFVGGDRTIDSNGSPFSFSLTSNGGTDQTIDFGYYAPCSGAIGDFVWQDTNLNGTQGSGEPGIDGVTVRLKDGSGNILATAVTNLGGTSHQPGYYQFTGRCAGTYTVEVDASTLPPGVTATASNAGGDAALDSNGSPATVTLADDYSSDQTVDFGYQPPCEATLGDFVWNDGDRDGIQDASEAGINGVTVLLLDDNMAQIATATTHTNGSQDGYYQFGGRCAGTYYVKVDETTVPPGMVATPANVGADRTVDSNNNPTLVTLPLNNSSDQTLDFGYNTPCSGAIGNYVWHDLNRDGIQDADEPGMNGITVNLKDSAGTQVLSTTTSPGGTGSHDGYYQFTGLCYDTYTVEVNADSLPLSGYVGYTPAPANQGSDIGLDSDDSPVTVNLPTDYSTNQTIDFGYLSPCTGMIGDYVWEDSNQNGVQDAGEPGIDGVTLQLKDGSGNVIATTVTNTGGPNNQPGYYHFDGLCAGSYTVEVVSGVPAGFTATVSGAGGDSAKDSNGSPALVVLGSDIASDTSIDFGFKPPCAGTIGDFVWADLNQNGLQDDGEPGINGVTVRLKDGSGTVIATEATYTDLGTGQQGYYQFSGLCTGDYTIEVVDTTLPAGYAPTASLVGGDRSIDSNGSPTSATLATNGASDQTIDFGYIPPAALGDYVWIDANGNGLQDAGETPLDGILVELYRCGSSTLLATTPTGLDGKYRFTALQPGSYYVRFISSTAYPTFTTANAGSNDAIDSDADASGYTACVTLAPGQTYNDLDAGLQSAGGPPNGGGNGEPLTIGYWKTHTSCDGAGGQNPVLDQTMALAEPGGIAVGILTLHGSTATPNQAPDCLKAIRLLDKSTIDTAKKKASDPAFGLAAQYLAARVNVLHDAKTCSAQTNALSAGQSLLAAIHFNGITHDPLNKSQSSQLNSLATTLDDYNNARLCP
jgi:hypothetical protein